MVLQVTAAALQCRDAHTLALCLLHLKPSSFFDTISSVTSSLSTMLHGLQSREYARLCTAGLQICFGSANMSKTALGVKQNTVICTHALSAILMLCIRLIKVSRQSQRNLPRRIDGTQSLSLRCSQQWILPHRLLPQQDLTLDCGWPCPSSVQPLFVPRQPWRRAELYTALCST